MIELYQMEGCPFCKKVRQKLEELDVTYISVPCGADSKNRETLIKIGGQMQVPFLRDIEKNIAMYESDDIVGYLEKTYGAR